MRSLYIILIATVILGGCAEKWQKPDASSQDFESSYYDCMKNAYYAFPSTYRAVIDEAKYKSRLITTKCESRNPSVICKPVKCNYIYPLFTPYCAYVPSLAPIDFKEKARHDVFNACMAANGWTALR